MELFLAILLCLFFIALLILGEIYLEIDKLRTRAAMCIRQMKEHLDRWVTLTVELYSGLKSADDLRTLSESYFSCRKYRESFKKISLVNTMAALSDVLANEAPQAENDRILSERADAAAHLVPLQNEYNQCVNKMNRRLNKKIPAAVGRLFRVDRLEELHDLSEA